MEPEDSPSSPRGDLAQRLAAAYGRLRNIEEQGWNAHHRFSFVSLGQITEPVRQAMAEAGVVVLPSVVEAVEEPWEMRSGTGMKITLTVEFTWIAAESGESMTTRWKGVGFDGGDKAYNKAYSAILKQALQKTFLISSAMAVDEDPDAESPEPPREQGWDRLKLVDDIRTLLYGANLAGGEVAAFEAFLAESYDATSIDRIAMPDLEKARHRLCSMSAEERRSAVLAKVASSAA